MDRITSISTNPVLKAQNIDNVTIEAVKGNQVVTMELRFYPNDNTQQAINRLVQHNSQTIQNNPINANTGLSSLASLNITPTVNQSTPVNNTGLSHPKLQVDPSLQTIMAKIMQNSYGNSILQNILNHPNLTQVVIKKPEGAGQAREDMGLSPTAKTILTLNSNGKLSAVIEMDPDLLATIITDQGQPINVGSDNVLFHELAHVQLELNKEVDHTQAGWDVSAENIAADYEGRYGGYDRNYFGSGTHVYWA